MGRWNSNYRGLKGWLNRLFPDRQALLLDNLKQDYLEEKRLAAQLRKHAERLPYDFMKQRLLKLSAEEEKHAELLCEKVTALGGFILNGEVPTIRTAEKVWQELLWDLEEERQRYDRYVHRANQADEEGLRKLYLRLRDEEYKHEQEIRDIIMRLNM